MLSSSVCSARPLLVLSTWLSVRIYILWQSQAERPKKCWVSLGLCKEARFTHDVKAHDVSASFENSAKPEVTSCHLIDSLSRSGLSMRPRSYGKVPSHESSFALGR
jgi:hypothetical protein